jgi:hypothetical protein
MIDDIGHSFLVQQISREISQLFDGIRPERRGRAYHPLRIVKFGTAGNSSQSSIVIFLACSISVLAATTSKALALTR